MRLLAYKQPIWTLNGQIYQFDPAHFDANNVVALTVSDDDLTFDGMAQGDTTQQMTVHDSSGAEIDSGIATPYFRYTMQTEAGDTFLVEQFQVDETVYYIIPDIPTDGISFVILRQEFVDGALTSGLDYADLPKFHCFAPGTLIETAAGPRPVEGLRPGDRVLTFDDGLQPLVWTGGAQVAWDAESPHRPVRLCQPPACVGQAFAPLTVSAQHRVLVAGPAVEMLFDLPQAFAPAAGLANGAQGEGVQAWHHIVLSNHQIVRANGLWVESLLTSDRTLSWLPEADRAIIRSAVPAPMTPARPCLTKAEAQLLARCARTGSRAA